MEFVKREERNMEGDEKVMSTETSEQLEPQEEMIQGEIAEAAETVEVEMAEIPTSVPVAGDWTCPECGTGNDGNFCFRCGSPKPVPAPEPELEAEASAAAPVASGWICPQCGNGNDGNFCFRCGSPKPVPAPEPEPESEAPVATAPVMSKGPTATAAATPEAPEGAAPATPETPAAAPKRKVKPWIWAVVAAVVVIGIGIGAFMYNQSSTYDKAAEAYAAGDYSQAAEEFQKLGNYKDSAAMYDKSSRWVEAQQAESAAEKGNTVKSWRTAAEAYEAIGDDAAKQKIAWCYEHVDYWTAMDMIEEKPTDRDTVTKALALFEKCNDIDYISDRIAYCEDVLDYYEAGDLYAQGHYYDAYEIYDQIGINAAAKLGDVEAKRDSCIQSSPGNGVVYRNDSYSSDACELTIVNSGNPNAYYKLYIGSDLVMTVFINADESATFTLPAGVYNMNKAYGDMWFGPDDMFGDDGNYFVCSFGGNTSVELEANNAYEISTGGEGTGIGTRSVDRNSI